VQFLLLAVLAVHETWPIQMPADGVESRDTKTDNHELSEIISKNSLLTNRQKQFIQQLAMQNTNLQARDHTYSMFRLAPVNIYVLLFKTKRYS